jgi:hypothetical protein
MKKMGITERKSIEEAREIFFQQKGNKMIASSV